MKKYLLNIAWLLLVAIIITSCNKEEIVKEKEVYQQGEIAVKTEITVDGDVPNTRAAGEAGYTTGDGLYHKGDKVIVAAFANDGYELVRFYDKKYPSTNLGSSYDFPAKIPQTFKAEFVRKFTISASASPSEGGTVTGDGKYKNGTSCTLVATPNGSYTFNGWYEGSTKVSSDVSYTFTVSSNRNLIAQFAQDVLITAHTLNGDLHLTANKPVKSSITSVCEITVEIWREENGGESSLVYSETLTVNFTIPSGATKSNIQHFDEGGDGGQNHRYYSIDSQNHSTWNNKTFDGITYRLVQEFLKY